MKWWLNSQKWTRVQALATSTTAIKKILNPRQRAQYMPSMAVWTLNPHTVKTSNYNSHRWIQHSSYKVMRMLDSWTDNLLGSSSLDMMDTKRYRIVTRTTLEPINKITKKASQRWGSIKFKLEVDGLSSCSLCIILAWSIINSIMLHLLVIRFKQLMLMATLAKEFRSTLYTAISIRIHSMMIPSSQPILAIPTYPPTHNTKARWLQDFLLREVTAVN